jgi:hypothetical protein
MQVETEGDRTSWFGVRELFAQPLFTILGVLLCVLIAPSAFAKANGKSVLVPYSTSNRGSYDNLNFLKSELRTRIPWPLDFYVEYLEIRRLDKALDLGMRLYWPKETPPSILPAGEGTWKPPAVVQAA